VPFLDHRVISFCFSAPLTHRIADFDKRLSRAMARRGGLLPELIAGRTDKRGFATPYQQMLATDAGARGAVARAIDAYTDRRPGIFRREVLHGLLEEHNGRDLDLARRIFRALTCLMYLDLTGYDVVD
jgi:hypothetical protein